MENKYYIPILEEFHIGFIYELWEEDICEDYSWKQYAFTLNDMAESMRPETKHRAGGLLSGLEEEYIRVKYLDREDIESLGFVLINDEGYPLMFEKDNISIVYYPDMHHVLITKNNGTIDIKLFQGTIKNKSELKTLLKWLNITLQN